MSSRDFTTYWHHGAGSAHVINGIGEYHFCSSGRVFDLVHSFLKLSELVFRLLHVGDKTLMDEFETPRPDPSFALPRAQSALYGEPVFHWKEHPSLSKSPIAKHETNRVT
ncbi:MAG: hypothetical protein EOP04_09625 [Proteobacteria bacterium]|nr:MAG: hypothetical protein EOP04_09625 [Pseudomonadota bacterium]